MLDSENDSECSFYDEDDQICFIPAESIKQEDSNKPNHAQWNLTITNEDNGWDSDGSHSNGAEVHQGNHGNQTTPMH